MSNKADATNMKQAIKRELKPKLRFPEFRDAGEWEEKQLDEVANFAKAKIPLSELTVQNYVSTENILPDFAGITHANRLPPTGAATAFLVGDILISNIRPYLKKIWHSEFDGGASNDVLIVRAKKSINDKYLSFVLINDFFINYVMTGAKGVKMPRGDISLIEQFGVPLPASSKEQQKIADCLASLDELIAAQTQKLATLKTHKKGLMQQLFPAEGETLPRLRFPEFRDAGEWEEKTLGQVAKYENGKAHEQDIAESGKFIVVNSKFVSTDGEVKKFTNTAFCIAEKEDILMVLSDVPNGRAIAKCFFVDSDNLYTVNQRICKITPRNASSILLFYVLNRNSYFLAFDDGVKQTNLKKDDVLDCPILLPSDIKEQQKIADFLSSLDELIAAQTQKLATLKTHKKGLMQQLFPALDDDCMDAGGRATQDAKAEVQG